MICQSNQPATACLTARASPCSVLTCFASTKSARLMHVTHGPNPAGWVASGHRDLLTQSPDLLQPKDACFLTKKVASKSESRTDGLVEMRVSHPATVASAAYLPHSRLPYTGTRWARPPRTRSAKESHEERVGVQQGFGPLAVLRPVEPDHPRSMVCKCCTRRNKVDQVRT